MIQWKRGQRPDFTEYLQSLNCAATPLSLPCSPGAPCSLKVPDQGVLGTQLCSAISSWYENKRGNQKKSNTFLEVSVGGNSQVTSIQQYGDLDSTGDSLVVTHLPPCRHLQEEGWSQILPNHCLPLSLVFISLCLFQSLALEPTLRTGLSVCKQGNIYNQHRQFFFIWVI